MTRKDICRTTGAGREEWRQLEPALQVGEIRPHIVHQLQIGGAAEKRQGAIVNDSSRRESRRDRACCGVMVLIMKS